MKYFTIDELCYSDKAKELKIENKPDSVITSHLNELGNKLLDPLREKWASYCTKNKLGSGALKVSSGYRCLDLNKAVGGVATSAHLFGYAADIVPVNGKQDAFEKWVSSTFIKSKIKFDQILIEKNKSKRWIHFGYKNQLGRQRMQSFKITK